MEQRAEADSERPVTVLQDVRLDSSKWRTLVGEGYTIVAVDGYAALAHIGNVGPPPYDCVINGRLYTLKSSLHATPYVDILAVRKQSSFLLSW